MVEEIDNTNSKSKNWKNSARDYAKKEIKQSEGLFRG